MKTHAAETQSPFERFASGNPHVEIKQEFWITNALVVTVDRTQIPLERLGTIKNVERVHENFEIKAASAVAAAGNTAGVNNISTTSTESYTWGLNAINIPQTWDRFGAQGRGVDIAILDTGVDDSHPDIEVDRWKDFDNVPSTEPKDYGDHGTHVSGTVVGKNNSGTHVGVAPKADLWHGAVLTEDCDSSEGCTGSFTTVIEGLQWATENNADIVSMSLGADGYYSDLIDPIQNARQAGTLPIASSGNMGVGTSTSPGNVYESVAVGATNSIDEVASYSSGEEIKTSENWSNAPDSWPASYTVPDIAAPGSNINSSLPGGNYGFKSGTSMAAPHVSGTAALVISNADTALTPDEIETSLETTAVDLNEDPTRQGSGRLNALAAVDSVSTASNFDVQIISISGPVVEKEEIVVEYRVENTGEETDTQSIEFAADGIVESSGGITLNSGESTTGTFSYTTTSEDVGTVEVAVSSNDDTATETVTVHEAAFYTVRIDAAATDTTVAQGKNATVVAEVENTGGVSDTQDITLDWNQTGTAEEIQSVSLTQGETEAIELTYQLSEDAPTGEVPVQVSSEDNNETVTITVQEQGKSQLSNLQVGDTGETATILEGNQTDLSVAIENIGEAETTFNITAVLAEEGAEPAIVRHQNITLAGGDPAETVTFTDITSTLPDGEFDVTVETSDDTVTGNLTVLKQGNLTISEISVPDEARQNDSVTVDATLSNDGDVELEQRIAFSAIETATDTELATQSQTIAVSGRSAKDIGFNFTVPDDQRSNITAEIRTNDDKKNTTIEIIHPRINTLVVEESGSRINDTATITAKVANADSVTLGLTAEFTSFRASADGAKTTDPATTTTGDTKTYTATIEQSVLDAAGDGTFTPFAVATDERGNEATATNESQAVIFDTTAPQIQLGLDGLGTTTASLTVDGNEAFTVTAVSITAENGKNLLENPKTNQPFNKSKTFDFNGTPIHESETTFNIKTTTRDQAGNTETDTLNSSITAYEITNNTARVASESVDSNFDLNVSDDVGDGEQRNATIAQSDAPPTGTETASNQITGEFFNVTDIGLNDSELEEATISIPVDEVDVDAFEEDELVIFFSDGNSSYEPIETDLENNNLTATVPGFSGGAAGGIDNRPPTIDYVRITSERTVDANDTETVSVTVDYSPNISAINTSQTTASVEGTDGVVDTQITKNTTEVTVREIENGETISVTVTVVDEADNEATVSETITVEAEQTDTTNDDDGSSGGSGGGGGAASSSGDTPAGDSGPATIQQVRDTLQLVTPQTDSETPLQDTDTEQPGLTVRPEQATSVNQITFNNEALTGRVRIVEYGTPPQVVSKKLRESIAADIPELDTDGIEASTITEIAPTVRATEDSSATVEFVLDRDAVNDPSELAVLKETYSEEAQAVEWQQAETTLKEQNADEVVLEVDVESFSLFTIAEVDQGESAQPANETTETTETTDDGVPGFGITVVIIAILVVSLAQRRKR